MHAIWGILRNSVTYISGILFSFKNTEPTCACGHAWHSSTLQNWKPETKKIKVNLTVKIKPRHLPDFYIKWLCLCDTWGKPLNQGWDIRVHISVFILIDLHMTAGKVNLKRQQSLREGLYSVLREIFQMTEINCK